MILKNIFFAVTVLVILPCFVNAQNAPNTTLCTPGVSLCTGVDFNCACQNGGICGSDQKTCNCTYPLIWGGHYCENAQCVGPNFPNGCVFGTCVGPGVCTCQAGYTGFDCSQPLLCPTGSKCALGAGNPNNCTCQDGGTCGGANENQCACPHPNLYAGAFCNLVICAGANFPGGCNTGKCVSPDVCQCNPGWNGTDCSVPICNPACIHGTCVGPGVCSCSEGWSHCPNTYAICGCDENECLRAHSPCDKLSTCTNTIGSYTCSPCPAGYPGAPYVYYPGSVTGNFTVMTGGCNSTDGPYPTSATSLSSASPTSAPHTSASPTSASPTSAPHTSASPTTAPLATSQTTSSNSTDSGAQTTNSNVTDTATTPTGQSATTAPWLNQAFNVSPSLMVVLLMATILFFF